jgi:hypothetical protein
MAVGQLGNLMGACKLKTYASQALIQGYLNHWFLMILAIVLNGINGSNETLISPGQASSK